MDGLAQILAQRCAIDGLLVLLNDEVDDQLWDEREAQGQARSLGTPRQCVDRRPGVVLEIQAGTALGFTAEDLLTL